MRLSPLAEKERAIEIRRTAVEGEYSIHELATRFGVSTWAVYRILARSTYRKQELDSYGHITPRTYRKEDRVAVARFLQSIYFRQIEVASYLGVSKQNVWAMLNRETANPLPKVVIPVKVIAPIQTTGEEVIQPGNFNCSEISRAEVMLASDNQVAFVRKRELLGKIELDLDKTYKILRNERQEQ